MTTTYPGLFYFSFVGTCARHRAPAQPEEEGQGHRCVYRFICMYLHVIACQRFILSRLPTPPATHPKLSSGDSSTSSTFTPPATAADEGQPQSQWLTALVKSFAYRLMAWHVRGVKFEVIGLMGCVWRREA